MNRGLKILLALPVLAATLVLMVLLLPRGAVGTDLSRIGQGQGSLVLVFENHSPVSMDTLSLLKIAQREREDLVFLVADIGTPEGQAFRQRHAAFSGQLLGFDAGGQRISAGYVDDRAGLELRLAHDFPR
ncbi:MAG: hypothetical protein MEQ07_10645 [Aquimonas sp.]|nr:hypothetical protein [Aquimonas sp.]